MLRPDALEGIRRGEVDLAFRRWDRARVSAGTRLRTPIGLVEIVSVERMAASKLRADDARRSGLTSLAALKHAIAQRGDRPLFRIELRYAGPDPRDTLREQIPDATEMAELHAWLDRLDKASRTGPWTRATLRIIDDNPERRAPELAAELGRPTVEFKRDVRKLKEKGLTESLAIGYRLSPRGEAVLDHGGPARRRPPRPSGTPLPRTIGASATRALRAQGLRTLEAVAARRRSYLDALPGVGPVALGRLDAALDALGLRWAE